MVNKSSSPGIRTRLSACFGRAHTNESSNVTPDSCDLSDGGDACNGRYSCGSDPLSCLLGELRDQRRGSSLQASEDDTHAAVPKKLQQDIHSNLRCWLDEAALETCSGLCGHRWIHMLEHKYQVSDLDSLQTLMSHDRKMALELQAAEQEGLLCACLAMIMHHQVEERGYNQTGEYWFCNLEPDREETYWGSHMGSEDGNDDDDDQYGIERWRKRVGFVVWPRKSRWAVFVRQGAAAAFTQLRLMIAALDTPEDSSAANTKPSLPMGNSTPPVQTAQEDDTASDRLEIALLISAMYQEFKTSWRVFDEHKVPGFDSFGKFAIAFGLPHVYPGILAQKLNYRRLDASIVEELLHASQLLGWPPLSAIFDRLLHNTIRQDPHDRRREPLVKQIAAGFEALLLLLGGADADMHLVIAAHAAKLVAPLQELSLSTRLSRLTPGSTQVFATRKWPGVPGPDVNEEEGCRLIVLALSLFHSLSVKEYTRKLTIESSTHEAAGALVDMVLANPYHFDACEVLAPACIQIAEASLGSSLLPEFPAAIKLVAGCVRELQQAAQLQPTLAAESLCHCDTCQYLQAFLRNPDQRVCTIKLHQQATHVIMQMHHFANHHGHLCMQQDVSCDTYQFLCTKESYNERSERVQQANAVLPQVQAVFNQVVTSLFLRSRRAPAECYTARAS